MIEYNIFQKKEYLPENTPLCLVSIDHFWSGKYHPNNVYGKPIPEEIAKLSPERLKELKETGKTQFTYTVTTSVTLEEYRFPLVFKDLTYIGDLVDMYHAFPTTTLYEYDGELVVLEWMDNATEGEGDFYYYFKTTRDQLLEYISKEISHRDFIKSHPLAPFNWKRDAEYAVLKYDYDLADNGMPQPETFFEEEDCPDLDKILAYLK